MKPVKKQPEPPDERDKLTKEEMLELSRELEKFGRGLFLSNGERLTPEILAGHGPDEEETEPEPVDKPSETEQNDRLAAVMYDPSYSAMLGRRVGDFVSAAWQAAYGDGAKPPHEVVASAIAVYIAQHRGEGMG